MPLKAWPPKGVRCPMRFMLAAGVLTLGLLAAGCVSPPVDTSADCAGPGNLTGQQEAGPVNVLAWDAVDNVTGYAIYRSEGGDYGFTSFTNETTFTDTAIEAGVAYRYRVTGVLDGGGETAPCSTLEIAPIPDFPAPFAAALAVVGGVAVYAWRARKG